MRNRIKLASLLALLSLGLSSASMAHAADSDENESRSSAISTTDLESWGSHKSSGYGQRTHTDFQGRADGHYFPVLTVGGATASGATLQYNGGPVILNPTIYRIYYGTWPVNACSASDTSTAGVINNFLPLLGGSQWYKSNTTFYQINPDGTYSFIQPSVVISSNCVIQSAPVGTQVDSGTLSVANIVTNNLPRLGGADTNGIYLVLTSADIAQSGFKTQFCGYHGSLNSNSTNLLYMSVGDSGNSGSCVTQVINPANKSANSNPTADGMVSVIAHEIVETTSNPFGTSWWDSTLTGYENGDACAWIFGTTYSANGAFANTKMGNLDYLLQENVPAPFTPIATTISAPGCVGAIPSSSSVSPSPSITGVSAYTAAAGIDQLTITGTNFSTNANSTVVGFGGAFATPTSVSSTSLTVTVPWNAKSGMVQVITPSGVANSATSVTITPPATAQAALSISNTTLTLTYKTTSASNGIVLTTSGGTVGGAVAYSVNGLNCRVTKSSTNVSTLYVSAPSTCVVTAVKAADSSYAQAVSAPKTFKFGLAQSALTISNTVTSNVAGTQVNLTSSGGLGTGNVTFATTTASCSISSAVLTVIAPVNCAVIATKAADANYLAATSASKTFSFSAAPQTNLALTPDATTGPAGTPMVLTASGGSGTGTYSFTTATTGCTAATTDAIAGKGTINRASTTGSCTVTVTRAKSGIYNAATATASVTFNAIPQSPALALTPSAQALVKGTALTLGTTGGSGTGAITFSVTNTTICKLTTVGGRTTLTVATTVATGGTCTVTATKAASTIYLVSSASASHTY
jgi:hypothetical protein